MNMNEEEFTAEEWLNKAEHQVYCLGKQDNDEPLGQTEFNETLHCLEQAIEHAPDGSFKALAWRNKGNKWAWITNLRGWNKTDCYNEAIKCYDEALTFDKDAAFKEEQECRIVKILQFTDEQIHISEDYSRMHVEYIDVRQNVEEVVFGPTATGIDLFQDILQKKGLNIQCTQSKLPLA